MRQPILSPEKFAAEFNALVVGASRKIDKEDISDMTSCGLIGQYGYYGRSDLETVRAVLQYEQLRHDRAEKLRIKEAPKTCKRCGKPLPKKGSGRGRPREFCDRCELFRGRERHMKWRNRKVNAISVR